LQHCEIIRDKAKPGAATDIVINTTLSTSLPADQLKPKRQKAVPISAAPKTCRQQSTRPAAIEKSVFSYVQLLSTASSLFADPVQTEVDQNSVELVDLKAEVPVLRIWSTVYTTVTARHDKNPP